MDDHRLAPALLIALLATAATAAPPRWTVTSAPPPPGEALAVATDAGALVVYSPSGRHTWSWDGSAWTDLGPVPEALGERTDAAIAWDSGRHRAILFGGAIEWDATSETWELSGSTWSLGPAAPGALGVRVGHAMAYDAARSLTVLFGGSDDTTSCAPCREDTWLYDGASWLPGPQEGSGPPRRRDAAMGYDPARGVVVLFGGSSQTSDTWELDAGGWTPGGTFPDDMAAPAGARMTHLPETGQMVMYGGYFDRVNLGGTWLYDGIAWTQGPDGPPGRTAHGFVTIGQDAVLFGGHRVGEFPASYDDLVRFDGTAWQAIPQGTPGASRWSALASSPSGVLLFRGTDPAEVWSHDGAWSPMPGAPPALDARRSTAMAHDRARDRVVLFGGIAGNSMRADTWEIDASGAWAPGAGAPAGLAPRCCHAMAYDERRGRTVLFGGTDDRNVLENDTWEYDGASWLPGAPAPPLLTPRSGHTLTYDARRGVSVLVGGADDGGGLADVWEYDGAAWVPGVPPPTDFAPRAGHMAAYHESSGDLVVWSGEYPPDGLLWRYDGSTWEHGVAPPSDGDGTLAADADRGVLVLFDQARRTMEYGPVREGFVAGQGLAAENGNEVKLFDAAGGGPFADFVAYGAGQWGVNVASAHLDGAEHDRILTGPGPGAVYGPHCRAFDRAGAPLPGVSFFAYGTLKYGLQVGSGEIDGDGIDEILSGPGAGIVFGPHVRAFERNGAGTTPVAEVSFYAYATLRYGVNVAGGDVDGDGFAEILTGPGPSPTFAPQVRGFDHDGSGLRAVPGLDFVAFASGGHGSNVVGGDVDGDGREEMAVGAGPGAQVRSRILGYGWNGGRVRSLDGFDARPSPTRYGARAGLGDLDRDGREELLAAPGPDPAATADVTSYAWDGEALAPDHSFEAFTSMHGANVGGAFSGF